MNASTCRSSDFGMKPTLLADMAAVAYGMASPSLSSRIQLCPIVAFGIVPSLRNCTWIFSPGAASILVTLNFSVSLAVITIVFSAAALPAGSAERAAGCVAATVASNRRAAESREDRRSLVFMAVGDSGSGLWEIFGYSICMDASEAWHETRQNMTQA